MKTTSLLWVAVGSLLTIPAMSHAAAVVQSGSLNLLVSGKSTYHALYTSTSFSNVSEVLTAGYTSDIFPTASSMAQATYSVGPDGFTVSSVSLNRIDDTFAEVTGSITFAVDVATTYTLSGKLIFGENDLVGLTSLSTTLTGPGVAINNAATNTTLDSGTLRVNGASGFTGTLAPGTYVWTYSLKIADNGNSNDDAVATGRISLALSEQSGSIPEPATFGMMALAAGGLLIRRRK